MTQLYLVTNGPVKKLYQDPHDAVEYLSGNGHDLFVPVASAIVTPTMAEMHLQAGWAVQARSAGGKMVFATIEPMEVL